MAATEQIAIFQRKVSESRERFNIAIDEVTIANQELVALTQQLRGLLAQSPRADDQDASQPPNLPTIPRELRDRFCVMFWFQWMT